LVAIVIALLVPTLAACSSSSASSGKVPLGKGTVDLMSTPFGKILVTAKGLPLYSHTNDKHHCTGVCLQDWPLFEISGKATAGPGVKASLLGERSLGSGKYEVTYDGHILHEYFSDSTREPGEANGEGLPFPITSDHPYGTWFVIGANGKLVTHGKGPGHPAY
jgi:predicted lipoprotein with Yx(FWY)xxD motif